MDRKWWIKSIIIAVLLVALGLNLVPTLYEGLDFGTPEGKKCKDKPALCTGDSKCFLAQDSKKVRKDSRDGTCSPKEYCETDKDCASGSRCKDNKCLAKWYVQLYTALFKKKIHLGLDIQGGLQLTYEVNVKKGLSDKLDRYEDDIIKKIQDKKKGLIIEGERLPDYQLQFKFKDPKNMDLLNKEFYGGYGLYLVGKDSAKGIMTLKLSEKTIETAEKDAVSNAITTIRQRIDDKGIKEPSIMQQGTSHIQIQIPGLKERDFITTKAIIEDTRKLYFRMVEESRDIVDKLLRPANKDLPKDPETGKKIITFFSGEQPYFRANKLDPLRKFVEEKLKLGNKHYMAYQKVSIKKKDGATTEYWRTWVLKKQIMVTGESINNADIGFDEKQNPVVHLEFDREGAKKFGEATKINVGKKMAILLDDELNSAPVIREAITGGRAQISMGEFKTFNEILEDATQLKIVLKSGALPAPIQKQYETRVGAELGKDSINKGILASIIGLVWIFIFMMFYYKWAGLIAIAGLAANLIILISILVTMGATLTMPGIAGIALTLGMAVDANVLINERIKEELLAGKSVRSAVDAGYSRAFLAIFDSNITTAIAGLVLYQYGSGTIKGFALTLVIGIGTSMFTAITVTRLIFTYLANRKNVAKLSI